MIGPYEFCRRPSYSFAVSGLFILIIGHWAWDRTILATMGSDGGFFPRIARNDFHDLQEKKSTVVHRSAVLSHSPERSHWARVWGRIFKRDGGGPMPPHDLTIAAAGGLLLWFGWYGFNPGSTLSAMDFEGVGRVATNTTLCGLRRRISAMLIGLSEA